MTDSSSDELLKEINEKERQDSIVAPQFFGNGRRRNWSDTCRIPPRCDRFCGFARGVALQQIAAMLHDKLKKSVVLFYNLDDES